MGIMLSSGVRFCIEWIGREGSLSNVVGPFCILCYQAEYIYIYIFPSPS